MQRKDTHLNHSLKKDSNGVALIEFALIAPVFLMLLIGIIEFGIVYFVDSSLESAVREMSRYGIVGHAPTGSTKEEKIKEILLKETYGFIDANKVIITISPLSKFSGIPTPEPNIGDANHDGMIGPGEFTDLNCDGQFSTQRTDAGLADEAVVYEVKYPWKLFTPFVSNILGKDTINLKASIAVQNEPFSDLPLPGCP